MVDHEPCDYESETYSDDQQPLEYRFVNNISRISPSPIFKSADIPRIPPVKGTVGGSVAIPAVAHRPRAKTPTSDSNPAVVHSDSTCTDSLMIQKGGPSQSTDEKQESVSCQNVNLNFESNLNSTSMNSRRNDENRV